jgi:N4-(beta-N-acetylglucosaminyl)-L-asparaginase
MTTPVFETHPIRPLVVSTWPFGKTANDAAWALLAAGGSALDAIEAGARRVEADPSVTSVGYGGRPNSKGVVELDAAVMDGAAGRCGCVAALQGIAHPVSVARKVMENTPHVFLAGDGARDFALAHGFKSQDLLTPESKEAWQEWVRRGHSTPGHDTLGILAIDSRGNIGGACTSSGIAYKLPGRVGDSPIIGAGLYVDNNVGAATATGVGEEAIRISASFLIVEQMRSGKPPLEACREAVDRVIKNHSVRNVPSIAFLAVTKRGLAAAFATYAESFTYCLRAASVDTLQTAPGRLSPRGQ